MIEYRKKKRREFAQMRDKECEGMTEEQKQEWMQQQKDASIFLHFGMTYSYPEKATNERCHVNRTTNCH